MIYFREESQSDYENYKFGYTEWGIPESEGDSEALYNQGYLPYSGSEKQLPVYYLCRSLRITGSEFKVSSENRRVLRKVKEAGIAPSLEIVSGAEAVQNNELINFFLNYFKEHHGESVMSYDRLVSILNYSVHVQVVVYFHNEEIIGAIITQQVGNIVHYWFSAYSDKYPDLPLGMWLMITFIQKYPEKTAYLGTGYGKKALYKTNIEQIEYFNGNGWKNDLKILKNRLKGLA